VRWRDLVLPLPPSRAGVTRIRNVIYGDGGGRPLKLDVYRPADARTGCPVLLFVHGGAWVIGDKREQGLPLMLSLARQGWVCFTANYRLCPRAAFPEPLQDLKQAVRWVREHGVEYGADPEVLVVSGASAGGHLTSLLALTANDPAYQPGFEDIDTSVTACVSWYGVYDLTNRLGAHNRRYVRFVERVLVQKKLADAPEVFAAGSPMDVVHAGAPPFMIVAGDCDTLVPVSEARHFASLLRGASRAPVVYAELHGAQHAFDLFWSSRAAHAVAGAIRFCEMVRRGAHQPAPRV
jgi:acetyl esterase/lipase